MPFYNQHLDDQNYSTFYDPAGDIAHLLTISDCYEVEHNKYKAIIGQGGFGYNLAIHQNHNNKVVKMQTRLSVAWRLFQLLHQRINLLEIEPSSHLKAFVKNNHNQTISPPYTACVYVSIRHEGRSARILNFSITGGDINIEIRYPDHFPRDEFLQAYPGFELGGINGIPTISIRKFLAPGGAALLPENDLAAVADDRLAPLVNVLEKYVNSIIAFVARGNNLNPTGQSKAELVLKDDLSALYNGQAYGGNWLRHGDSPILRATGSWLELDLQLAIQRDGIVLKIAIEIQGRDHYELAPGRRGNFSDTLAKHKEKISWCGQNNVLFVWLDWHYYDRCYIKNGQHPRDDHSRREMSRLLIETCIARYQAGSRFEWFHVPPGFNPNRPGAEPCEGPSNRNAGQRTSSPP